MPRYYVQFLIALGALASLVVGCGRPDIEQTQRRWLDDQHALEQRLISARERHTALRRQADSSSAAAATGADTLGRGVDPDSLLLRVARQLDSIAAMIDRQTLLRDNAIRADDADAVKTAWDAAKVEYGRADSTLGVINDVLGEIQRALLASTRSDSARVDAASVGDTIAGSQHSTTPGSGGAKDTPVIDNKMGRDEPLEPE